MSKDDTDIIIISTKYLILELEKEYLKELDEMYVEKIIDNEGKRKR